MGEMMDITYVLVFLLVNILPANINNCKLYSPDNQQVAIIEKQKDGTWKFSRTDGEATLYKVEANKITNLASMDVSEMSQMFKLETFPKPKIKKFPHKIEFKNAEGEKLPTILINQQKSGAWQFSQSGESAWFDKLILKFK